MIYIHWIKDVKTNQFYFKRGVCHHTLISANIPSERKFDDIPRGWFEITPKVKADIFKYDVLQHRAGWDAWNEYKKTHPRTRELPAVGHFIGSKQPVRSDL